MIDITCENCGKIFQNYPSNQRRFCSTECSRKMPWKKHGQSRTRLHNIWSHMKTRCGCPTSNTYAYYGGRGISVCKEWESFEVFRDWAMANGYKDTLSIDRIENDKGYCPENCRWATHSQQMRNTRKHRNSVDSKYRGVCRNCNAGKKNPWRVQLRLNGTTKYCGSYPTEVAAAQAYDRIVKAEFGDFAILNFPENK